MARVWFLFGIYTRPRFSRLQRSRGKGTRGKRTGSEVTLQVLTARKHTVAHSAGWHSATTSPRYARFTRHVV